MQVADAVESLAQTAAAVASAWRSAESNGYDLLAMHISIDQHQAIRRVQQTALDAQLETVQVADAAESLAQTAAATVSAWRAAESNGYDPLAMHISIDQQQALRRVEQTALDACSSRQ